MEKKVAKDLKPGDKISVFGKVGVVEKIDISEIGKQGRRKVRIEIKVGEEKSVMIRPDDYPFMLK